MLKPIENYKGYFVSDDGKVYCNLGRGNRDRNKTTNLYEIKPRLGKRGYCRIYARNSQDNKRRDLYIHRLVAKAFVPNPENKPIVDHIDSNPTNNKASNLRWVSQEENLQNIETHKKIAERMASASRIKEINSLIKKCLSIEPNKLELIKAIADYSE